MMIGDDSAHGISARREALDRLHAELGPQYMALALSRAAGAEGPCKPGACPPEMIMKHALGINGLVREAMRQLAAIPEARKHLQPIGLLDLTKFDLTVEEVAARQREITSGGQSMATNTTEATGFVARQSAVPADAYATEAIATRGTGFAGRTSG